MASQSPPFLPQETDFSCAVACLRMVIATFGVAKPEEQLRDLCDCTIFGIAALELVRAARSLGFARSRKYSLDLSGLKGITGQGYFPIVYVVLNRPADVHALVVLSISDSEISVIDPKQRYYPLSLSSFGEMWSPMNNLAVVVAK